MKKSIMYTLGLAALFCAACVDNSTNGSGGGEVDALLEKYNNPNGGSGGGGNQKVYEKVQIGTQIWMSKNLNDDVEGSRCYDRDPANCVKYGRLYDWYTARTICPVGWHLPSDAEWTTLENQVGGQATAGKKLKSKSGWETWWDSNGNEVSGNGTDDYGFAALPGGYGSSDGNFDAAGYDGYWWSSSDNDSYVWYRYMDFHSEYLEIRDGNKASLRSVRCVQD